MLDHQLSLLLANKISWGSLPDQVCLVNSKSDKSIEVNTAAVSGLPK